MLVSFPDLPLSSGDGVGMRLGRGHTKPTQGWAPYAVTMTEAIKKWHRTQYQTFQSWQIGVLYPYGGHKLTSPRVLVREGRNVHTKPTQTDHQTAARWTLEWYHKMGSSDVNSSIIIINQECMNHQNDRKTWNHRKFFPVLWVFF